MDQITLSANRVGPIRSENLMGRAFKVFPAVLVREQVLNNNLGATFLPAEEIEASVDAWNSIPVTLRHPTQRGQPISARQPGVLNASGIGFLFNARYQDGALKADVYLDPARLSAIEDAGKAINRVEQGEVVEVSTGFTTRVEPETGAHNGERYEAVLRGIRPDHFAVLDNEKGACSVDDGCGLGANAHQEAEDMGRIERLLVDMKAALGIFGESPTATQDEPSAENAQESTMKRDEMIAHLEEQGLDPAFLADLSDCRLKALVGAEDTEEAANAAPSDEDAGESVTLSREAYDGLMQRLDKLEQAAEPAINEIERERADLIETLAANERCTFTADELKAKGLPELKKLAAMAQIRSYGGRPLPTPDATNTEPAFMPVRPYWETPNSEAN